MSTEAERTEAVIAAWGQTGDNVALLMHVRALAERMDAATKAKS